jgi:ribosomal-protein-alanine N-acetyltransferase
VTAVRPLHVDDLDALYALERASQPLPWSDDQLLLELVHDDALVLGCDDDSGLCGYVALRQMVDELWVLNVAVHPRARRRGLGRRLLDVAWATTRARALASLWLEVRESNAGARALYQSCGFTERGRRPGYYPPIPPATARETAVLLARSDDVG